VRKKGNWALEVHWGTKCYLINHEQKEGKNRNIIGMAKGFLKKKAKHG